MQKCPCGSGRPFPVCCEPFLEGQSFPETAEELMRSRYSAYAQGNVDYVLATQVEQDREAVKNWSDRATFQALRVLTTEGGGAGDSEGLVDFEADYLAQGVAQTHRERSTFRRIEDRWTFVKGQGVPVTAPPRVGRNDPCLCGSGKKFKKCCGA